MLPLPYIGAVVHLSLFHVDKEDMGRGNGGRAAGGGIVLIIAISGLRWRASVHNKNMQFLRSDYICAFSLRQRHSESGNFDGFDTDLLLSCR